MGYNLWEGFCIHFSLLFIVIRGVAVWKGKNCCFPFHCVISCDNEILGHLLINSYKELYTISGTQACILILQQNEGICKKHSRGLLKYQRYIYIYSPILVKYYKILYKHPIF